MTKADADAQMDVYRALQADMQKLGNTRQQLISQVNENGMVKQELDLLDDSATVFKLVGPVLMTIDLEEAKENVAKRVEFIETEISKLDAAIATKQGDQTTLGEEISKLQTEMQKSAAEAAQAVANQATEE